MNSTELAVLRQRCDRGETFTAEEMEYALSTIENFWNAELAAYLSGFTPELMATEAPDAV